MIVGIGKNFPKRNTSNIIIKKVLWNGILDYEKKLFFRLTNKKW